MLKARVSSDDFWFIMGHCIILIIDRAVGILRGREASVPSSLAPSDNDAGHDKVDHGEEEDGGHNKINRA